MNEPCAEDFSLCQSYPGKMTSAYTFHSRVSGNKENLAQVVPIQVWFIFERLYPTSELKLI